MRIRTDLTWKQIYDALREVQNLGLVSENVYFDKFTTGTSRTHKFGYDIHLVSDVKEPGSKRRRPNSGAYGYDGHEAWAATYDEWGWFLAAVFDADPAAIAGHYKGIDHFHATTDYNYR